MPRLITYSALVIAAGVLFALAILAAAGLNPFDVMAGVWGAL